MGLRLIPLLAIDDLLFSWQPGPPLLDIAQLHLAPGESLFLRGPSGSGKSTLLNVVGGVLAAARGAIRLLDTDLAALRPAARDRMRADHIGFVFQQFNLLPYLDAVDNVLLACAFSRLRAARAGPDPRAHATTLLRRLDLDVAALAGRPAAELSVGQQQRVAAARALIGAPELVVADEPTSALDRDSRDRFLELLFDECRQAGTALLFVSHDRSLQSRFDRVIDLAEINRAGHP